jgi:hypothetical protein
MAHLEQSLPSPPDILWSASLLVLKAHNEVAGGKRRFAARPPEREATIYRIPKGCNDFTFHVSSLNHFSARLNTESGRLARGSRATGSSDSQPPLPAPLTSFQDADTFYYVYRGRHGETPFAPGYYLMCFQHGRSSHSARGHFILSIPECWAKVSPPYNSTTARPLGVGATFP